MFNAAGLGANLIACLPPCPGCTLPCRHFNRLHGYQLNNIVALKGLELYKRINSARNKQLINGHEAYDAAEAAHNAGDLQLLVMMTADKQAHTIRAYKFARYTDHADCGDVESKRCHIITIADPNFPWDGECPVLVSPGCSAQHFLG